MRILSKALLVFAVVTFLSLAFPAEIWGDNTPAKKDDKESKSEKKERGELPSLSEVKNPELKRLLKKLKVLEEYEGLGDYRLETLLKYFLRGLKSEMEKEGVEGLYKSFRESFRWGWKEFKKNLGPSQSDGDKGRKEKTHQKKREKKSPLNLNKKVDNLFLTSLKKARKEALEKDKILLVKLKAPW